MTQIVGEKTALMLYLVQILVRRVLHISVNGRGCKRFKAELLPVGVW